MGVKNGINIDVRPVTCDDAAEVCNLCCTDLGYQCDKTLVKERISQLDSGREAVFVAILDGYIVGFIHVEKYNTLYFETMANILGIAVSSKYRKMGVGKALIEQSEEWANENDIALMRLNTGLGRKGAHEFYKHMGYGSEKEQLRFVKRL
ncbi:MAG: GNAT family N-acetyltransferase [Eubacterium sp.]|nr:GNAT family N-acetyltransferase [Eubacterium sp.]